MDAGIPADAIAAARDAVKTHLRAAGGGEDGLIAQHAASALGLCEAYTGQLLIVRALTMTLAARRDWQRLTHAPVRAISGVAWLPVVGEPSAIPVGVTRLPSQGVPQRAVNGCFLRFFVV
ncbi:hypothetical protein FPZ54_15905 [Sphingomonas suaedae]|uniref:Uncharacterized protein n=1 Tax=Sphingomonas suaedae TaxID=2599297 RepID=A0A518RIS9_9SPHN|nr:hypothetical protein [Sphingomonas suaedae]QDX27342.1 hypothetical protein FPZ54_15905 [Sphingomonas suaedae]